MNTENTIDLCKHLGVDKNHLVQKVLLYKKDFINYPCIVQEKYDGIFCFAILIEDQVHIFSRVGIEYLSMEHLKEPLFNALKVIPDKKIILFEAYIKGVHQEVISGYCRDTQNQHTEIIGIVHDALTLDEYFGKTQTSYEDRFAMVRTMLADEHSIKLTLPKTIIAHDIIEVENYANRIWERGGEGIVIKKSSAHYQRGKRNASMMKLKCGTSFDLEVIDVIEGTGKYVGMAGKLACRFKDNSTIYVGTGFLDTERKQFWEDKNSIIGKIVQVNAMSISKNGVLREPTYKGIRYDKECADY